MKSENFCLLIFSNAFTGHLLFPLTGLNLIPPKWLRLMVCQFQLAEVTGMLLIVYKFIEMKISKIIVFIHGLHENAESWKLWKIFFEASGFICHSPNYPFHDGIPNQLRQKPNKSLAKIRLNDVVSQLYKVHRKFGR